MKTKAAFALLALMALSVAGAKADSITNDNVTPNPNGTPNLISASGTYLLTPGHSVLSITIKAKNVDSGQLNSAAAVVGTGSWSGSVDVVPGTYDVWAELVTTQGVNMWTTPSSKKTVTVN